MKYGIAQKGLHHITLDLSEDGTKDVKATGTKLFPIKQESGVDRSTIGMACPQLASLKA